MPGARSLCALASAPCCLGIFRGEGPSLGRGRGRCAPSRAPASSLVEEQTPTADRSLGVLGRLFVYLGRTNVLISVPGQQRKVASEGRFQLGRRCYVPPKRAPPTAFKRNQIPLSRARFGFAAAGQAEPGRTCPSFPTPSAKGLPPFPAGGSAGHQLNLLDHNGRRQGGPGPHPG